MTSPSIVGGVWSRRESSASIASAKLRSMSMSLFRSRATRLRGEAPVGSTTPSRKSAAAPMPASSAITRARLVPSSIRRIGLATAE